MTFFDCRADLVGQLSRDGWEGMLQVDAHPVENFWLHHCFSRTFKTTYMIFKIG